MLKFKNKKNEIVMTENTSSGEIKVFSEKLKDMKKEENVKMVDKEEKEKEEK